MAAEVVLFGSVDAMRQRAATIAVVQLIRESCFLSPERARHDACRGRAMEMLGVQDDDATILAAAAEHPRFALDFYCLGAASGCSACGGLIGPGLRACPECGQLLEQPVGVLAKPEWETRLVTKALEVAITTTLVANDFLMFTIVRTVRLFVLRNLLNQSDLDDWQARAREVRETVLDAWPEAHRPDRESWQYRFIRTCAAFWLVAWPMLKARFSLSDVDGWNTRLVRAAAISSQRWREAGADPQVYAALVRDIMDAEGLDRERAILALAPGDAAEDDQPAQARAVVLHPPELVYERSSRAYSRLGDAWLLIPLEPEEDELLAGKGVRVDTPEEVERRFSLKGGNQ